ncbi:hypothetical protein JYU34_015061 [Plutella xylostella]|uniref:Uncharacterized protein n=1 Tax=Plutella xylostella TaxID=51655 RepID=A0ABQ7Q7K9_PLUXY|nr:hypothetical protein JYU34_015061 [Plutella xylostella]
MEEWEEGMTTDDFNEYRERVQEKKEERAKEAEDSGKMMTQFRRFERLMAPFMPNGLNLLAYQLAYDHIQDEDIRNIVVATSLVLAYVTISWISWLLCSVFPPVLYLVNILVYPENRLLPIILLIYWVVRRVHNFFRPRDPTKEFWTTLNDRQESRSWAWLETYLSIGLLVGMTYSMNSFNYGQSFAGVWVLSVVILLAKHIPGVGANSTMGVLMILAFMLFGFLTIPDIMRLLLMAAKETQKSVVPPPSIDTSTNYIMSVDWGRDWVAHLDARDRYWKALVNLRYQVDESEPELQALFKFLKSAKAKFTHEGTFFLETTKIVFFCRR